MSLNLWPYNINRVEVAITDRLLVILRPLEGPVHFQKRFYSVVVVVRHSSSESANNSQQRLNNKAQSAAAAIEDARLQDDLANERGKLRSEDAVPPRAGGSFFAAQKIFKVDVWS